MHNITAKLLVQARAIVECQMPQANRCTGAHFAILKLPHIEREEIGTAWANYTMALRAICLSFRTTTPENRTRVLEIISALIRLLEQAEG